MAIWRIIPSARLDDPRWLDREPWFEVVVEAASPAVARQAAARLDRDPGTPPSGNECPSGQSAFLDEKLYRVVAGDAAGAASDDASGAPRVIAATRAGPMAPTEDPR